jgi:transcriptional regulator with XRE-family HTH domain
MSKDLTPADLRKWRKEEGLTQEALGSMLGWDKIVVTNIETRRRAISPAEQRLLKLLIKGEMPFPNRRQPWSPQIDFTEAEWALMTQIAHREGYHSARPWIVGKIRNYLAMCEPTQHQHASEDPRPYPAGKDQPA